MFTGIVTEIGKVKSVVRKGASASLEVGCAKVKEGVTLGDSIAVNGACLSVVKIENNSLRFDAVGNTLDKTTLKRLKASDPVNLESALKVGDALGGHMVSGHVDGERMVKLSKKTSKGWALEVGTLKGDEKYLLNGCSIAVDGVSLTVGEVNRASFTIYLIPHTLENTTLSSKKTGDYVNIEFDMMVKYAKKSKSNITKEMLAEKGFI